MNIQEIREIRRRLNPEKSSITHICGCMVNENREIVTQFRQSLGLCASEETEALFKIMKKSLSGSLGTNLINLEFAATQVVNGDEHKLLTELKNSELKDDGILNKFYGKVIETVPVEGNYVILLINDHYDTFTYTKDGMRSDDSTDVYSYVVCCVCPIKSTKPALSFHASDNTFHTLSHDTVIAAPEIGFLFPTFDDRQTNIYGVLYYTHDISDNHTDFTNAVFNIPLPKPAAEQRETFEECVVETIADDFDFEMIKSVHDRVSEIMEEHKQNKDPETLTMSKSDIENLLEYSGADETHTKAFSDKFDEEFGKNTVIPPQNLIDTKKFELATPDVLIKVNPERKDLVTTQIINGTKYIMIRADENIEVNGINIHIK